MSVLFLWLSVLSERVVSSAETGMRMRMSSSARFRDGDRCVKVFNENASKADILNEALNQARIEKSRLRFPKIPGVTMIDGKWTILSEFEFIRGKTLSQPMKEDTDTKAKYLNQFVKIRLEMQSKRGVHGNHRRQMAE